MPLCDEKMGEGLLPSAPVFVEGPLPSPLSPPRGVPMELQGTEFICSRIQDRSDGRMAVGGPKAFPLRTKLSTQPKTKCSFLESLKPRSSAQDRQAGCSFQGLAFLEIDPDSQTSQRERDTHCGAKGDGEDRGYCCCFSLDLIKARGRTRCAPNGC